MLVLLALADYANDGGYCWPSLTQLAKKTRLSRRQVITVVGDLVALAEIEKVRGAHESVPGDRRRTNAYRVVLVKPLHQGSHCTSAILARDGEAGRTSDGEIQCFVPLDPSSDPSLDPSHDAYTQNDVRARMLRTMDRPYRRRRAL